MKENSHSGVAAVLSFIFNGLGQIYNGQIKKGLFTIFLSSLSMFILIMGAILIGLWLFGRIVLSGQLIYGFLLFLLGLIFICILGIWSIFDAYNVADKRG
jgi:TM2 domain-containing membrane protein YozV